MKDENGELGTVLLVAQVRRSANRAATTVRYATPLLVPPAVRTVTCWPAGGRVPSTITSHATDNTCAAGSCIVPKNTWVAPQAKPLLFTAMFGPREAARFNDVMRGTT